MGADPATGLSVVAAVAAGFVSFLSPCVLPLVPGYLSAVTGVSPSELGSAPARRVIGPSLVFVASFSTVFVLLGVSATRIGSALSANRVVLEKIAAILIAAMGVLFVAALFVDRLNRDFHLSALAKRTSRGGPVVAGAAFALAWTPCVGPTLSAILTTAAVSHSALRGAVLLAFYAAGLAAPFLLSALAFRKATATFGLAKRHYRTIIACGGLILVAMGVLMWTNELFWLNIQAQQVLGQLGLNFFADI
jgi:cytochrome c-type biogenesis protein